MRPLLRSVTLALPLLLMWCTGGFAQAPAGLLYKGRIEARLFGGFNASPSRAATITPRTPPTFGAEAAFALSDRLAAIGTFAYDKGGTDPAFPGQNNSVKEWMGGMRLSLPLVDVPVVPYGSLSAGKVSFKQYSQGAPNSQGVSQTMVVNASAHAAIAPAVGMDIPFSKRVGVGIEFRAVKPTDAGIYYRLCGSLFVRLR